MNRYLNVEDGTFNFKIKYSVMRTYKTHSSAIYAQVQELNINLFTFSLVVSGKIQVMMRYMNKSSIF